MRNLCFKQEDIANLDIYTNALFGVGDEIISMHNYLSPLVDGMPHFAVGRTVLDAFVGIQPISLFNTQPRYGCISSQVVDGDEKGACANYVRK